MMRRTPWMLVALMVAACTSEPSTPTWNPLVTRSWNLPPGGENTGDIALESLERDMFVGGIRPIAPQGTHHTLLYRGQDITSPNVIYASGVGTNELVFPAGTGMKLTAGTLLGLSVHVFNTTDAPLSGLSGVEVLEVDPSTVDDEVDLVLAGPEALMLPPNQVTSVTGTCTATQRHSVFALFPHMHTLGSHFKTTLNTGAGAQVLHDAAYRFDEQPFLSFVPTVLEPGDTITTECTFNNTTGETVTYGESTTTEMCFSIMLRFPSTNTDTDDFCTH